MKPHARQLKLPGVVLQPRASSRARMAAEVKYAPERRQWLSNGRVEAHPALVWQCHVLDVMLHLAGCLLPHAFYICTEAGHAVAIAKICQHLHDTAV